MAHDVKLGQFIDESQQRDAIHIAVAPVVAGEKLAPGQDIGFIASDRLTVGVSKEPIGIVDPFLKSLVFPGQRFWMLLYPQTITSLRHDWTHPAFSDRHESAQESANNEKELRLQESGLWMEKFADVADLSFSQVMSAAKNYLQSGEYFVQYDSSDARDAIDEVGAALFWHHYQVLTGEVATDMEDSCFSCSC